MSDALRKGKLKLSGSPSLITLDTAAPNARCGASIKTLFRWKQSIYKLVWGHILSYYLVYVSLTALYQFVLEEEGRKHFEALARYFSKSASTLNLMIMLGFFTSTTLQRLFTMQTTIPGTAKTISLFIMSLKTDLPEGPIIVQQYARWAVLSWILAVRSVSQPVRKKYPDMISLQIKGVLQPAERLILERVETEGCTTPRPLVVIDWMLLLLKECVSQGRYNSKSAHHKNSCGNMIKFATRNLPYALIQAVIIAVYYFGLVTMLARELTTRTEKEKEGESIHDDEIVKAIISYVPIMPIMQFFIFFAWLTFGRMAVNPFGDDETDINLDILLESHIEDYNRLIRIYEQKLEDFFPDLPQKQFKQTTHFSAIDEASRSQLITSSSDINSITHETPLLSEVLVSSSNDDTCRNGTEITIDDSNTVSIAIQDQANLKSNWWKNK